MILDDLEQSMKAARRLEDQGKRALAKRTWERTRSLCVKAMGLYGPRTKVGEYLRWMLERMGRP